MRITRRSILKNAALAPITAALTRFASAATSATTHIVTIKDFTFDPPMLDAKIGDTVEWKNLDGFIHTATSDEEGRFDTKIIRTGRSKSHTFTGDNGSGEFSYHCQIYPMMKGKITVRR